METTNSPQDFFLQNTEYSSQSNSENTPPALDEAAINSDAENLEHDDNDDVLNEVENAISDSSDNDEIQKTSESTDKEIIKSRLPRGTKPPFLSLDEAVLIAQDVYELAGGGVSLDAFSQIVKNSIASSSFAKKVTTLRSYGLINTENRQVTLTELCDNIVAPRSLQEKAKALKTAFRNIEIFDKVYSRFCGRILPQDEFLINIFKDYVPRDVSPRWVEQFKRSAVFANLLLDRGDGKLQVIEDAIISEPKKAAENPPEEIPPPKPPEDSSVKPPPADEKPPRNVEMGNAIKKISLRDSNKTVWIGTDANMFEIKTGNDLNFILKLIRLFDEYESGNQVKAEENGL